MREQNPDSDLTQELLSLNNSTAAFVGHVTRLISKIETCIFNSDKVEKNALFKKEQLAVILEKLKAVNNKFISLNENAEDIESANEIFFEQNFRVLNTNEIIEIIFHGNAHLQNLCHLKVSVHLKVESIPIAHSLKVIPRVLHLFHARESK